MNRIFIAVAAMFFLRASPAFGCPCGCGTIAVGALEPGQRTKLITSLSSESSVKTVTNDGEVLDDYYYDRSFRTDVTVTQALEHRSNLTVSAGAYRNGKKDLLSDARPTDPSVSLGYTALQQDFTRAWLPRLDLYLSYKHPLARSFRAAESDPDEESFLAVGGNGLKEIALGSQAWFGMDEWKMGTTMRYTVFPEVVKGSENGPETGGVAAVQLAKVFTGRGGLGLEAGMEWLGETIEDGERVVGSSRRIDHASLSASYVVRFHHSLGMSLVRKNVFWLTKNSVAGQSLVVSYQAVFI